MLDHPVEISKSSERNKDRKEKVRRKEKYTTSELDEEKSNRFIVIK